MIFVDTNVFVYAVGRPHPLRDPARRVLLDAAHGSEALVTSCEVLEEFLHVYLPVERIETLDKAWTLATSRAVDIWSIEVDDLALARSSIVRHPELPARDLLHLACCRRREVRRIHTFDRALRAAVEGG
ncbi:MAG: type II toxin-antitoxin system VapC family toxin [Thermoanaerobaculales bacterium]